MQHNEILFNFTKAPNISNCTKVHKTQKSTNNGARTLNSTNAPKIFNSTNVPKTLSVNNSFKIKLNYYEVMFAECILVLKSYNLTTWQSNLKVDPDNKAIPKTNFDEQVVKKC